MNYTNLLKIDISAIIGLTIFAILIIGIIITERKFIKIQFRCFFKQKELIYLSLLHYFNRSKEKNNQNIRKFLSQKSGFIIPTLFRNKIGYEYWQNVYISYPEILLIALEKNISPSTIIEYFDELLNGRLKSYLNSKIEPHLFSQIIAKAISWCNPNERNHQHASRLGSISIMLKLLVPKKETEELNKKCWNDLLEPFIHKKLNVKYIYKDPFYIDSKNFKPEPVYNSGLKIFQFFKEIEFEEGANDIYEELKKTFTQPPFSEMHFK